MDPKEHRKKLIDECKQIAESAKKDSRDLSPEESQKVEANLKQAGELAAQLMAAQKSSDLLKQLDTASALNQEEAQPGEQTKGASDATSGWKTIGERVVESPQVKALHERYPTGVPESVEAHFTPVQLGSLKSMEQGAKALVNVGTNTTAAGNATPMVVNDVRGLIDPLFRPRTVLDLITRGATGSNTIEYFREVARTNAAAPVAEATATGGTSGTKPESAVRFERVTAPVRTIATWIPVTRQALADVAQLRTILDAYLMQFVEEALEGQVLNGDGTGENLTGIRTVASATEAFSVDPIQTVRRAMASVAANLVQPTGVVMNPADVVNIDLTQDANDRYLGQGPFGIGPRTLWGLPVAESTLQPAGEALVGDFRQAILYDREQAQILTGTINDQFIRNMLTLLVELRAALAVLRATAFRRVDLTVA